MNCLLDMKCQALFPLKNNSRFFEVLSATVVTCTLRVNYHKYSDIFNNVPFLKIEQVDLNDYLVICLKCAGWMIANSADPWSTLTSIYSVSSGMLYKYFYTVCLAFQYKKIIQCATHEKDPYVICGQRRPWSACAYAQADQGPCCPHTESMDMVAYVDEQQMLRSDCMDAHADLDLRYLQIV